LEEDDIVWRFKCIILGRTQEKGSSKGIMQFGMDPSTTFALNRKIDKTTGKEALWCSKGGPQSPHYYTKILVHLFVELSIYTLTSLLLLSSILGHWIKAHNKETT
jgi:hypothetical protein